VLPFTWALIVMMITPLALARCPGYNVRF